MQSQSQSHIPLTPEPPLQGSASCSGVTVTNGDILSQGQELDQDLDAANSTKLLREADLLPLLELAAEEAEEEEMRIAALKGDDENCEWYLNSFGTIKPMPRVTADGSIVTGNAQTTQTGRLTAAAAEVVAVEAVPESVETTVDVPTTPEDVIPSPEENHVSSDETDDEYFNFFSASFDIEI